MWPGHAAGHGVDRVVHLMPRFSSSSASSRTVCWAWATAIP